MNDKTINEVLNHMAEQGSFLISTEHCKKHMASTVMDLINYCNANPKKEITLYVSLYFPNSFNTIAILYDAIKSISNPISAIAIGSLDGYGSLIVAACNKGKRACLKHTKFSFQEPVGVLDAGANLETEFTIVAEETNEIRAEYERLLALETNQDINYIHQIISEERDFTALEAKELGIIDEVI